MVLQGKLGAKNAGTFDVGCACASFPTSLATGTSPRARRLRSTPSAPAAGYNDQITCSTTSSYAGCSDTARFDSYPNVKAQLDVGRGSTAAQVDYSFSDWSIYNLGGGDADGVDHFRAKNNTGVIERNMITTSCTGTGCCSGYGYSCN